MRFAAVRRATGVTSSDGFISGAGDLVVPANTRATLLLDYARTTNAYTVLETSGGAGSTLTLTYAEAAPTRRAGRAIATTSRAARIRGIRDRFSPAAASGDASRRSTGARDAT